MAISRDEVVHVARLARLALTEDEIGEYSGERKEIRPVTIATYQVITTRRKGVYSHLDLLDARDWGLIVYDEVHLLPAPIFRMTANLQARRRIGLTATLVREDTYAVASEVHDLLVKTHPADQEKIELIKALVAEHLDIDRILDVAEEAPAAAVS